MPDAKFESGSFSIFGDMTSQNFSLETGNTGHRIWLFTPPPPPRPDRVKSVIEWVLGIIFSNLQVHAARFVIFIIQRQSDTQVLMLTVSRQPRLLLVPWTENNLSSFRCGFLNIFSRQNLLRSLSSLLFLLRWNKNGAKKCLKNHIPFDF